MKLLTLHLAMFGFLFAPASGLAQDSLSAQFDLHSIQEPHPFYGLASYYNGVAFYKVGQQSVQRLDPHQPLTLKGEWLVAVGRFQALAIRADAAAATLNPTAIALTVPAAATKSVVSQHLPKNQLAELSPELKQLRYAQLWRPIAWLAIGAEHFLEVAHHRLGLSWGWAVLLLAIFIKMLTLPFSLLTARWQRQASQIKTQMSPILAQIKQSYSGEQAHLRLVEAYRQAKVSPFYQLKPMFFVWLQFPFWIAAFNALGEMPQFAAVNFLWVKDLSLPDQIASLGVAVPLLGDRLNLMPIFMTLVSLLATALHRDPHALPEDLRKQRRNLIFMAVGFLILFYPFPAVMVWYWSINNLLQILQARLVRS